jgi:murein DD-endopeptidase MepM/ murein hydrolase activator NlpD
MHLLVSAASAAFITAAGMFATASVPAVHPSPTPSSSATLSSGHTGPDGAKITRVTSRVPFDWPLSPRPAVLRPFDRPLDQWSPGHRGVDLLAAVGQAVLSAGEGIVSFSGVLAGRGVLTVQHSGGLRTTYEPLDERLTSGTLVHRGTRIGILSAVPGHCMPRGCLHWGAISGQDYRDPLSLLSFGRPILLPLG